jgi:hypothetical protein
LDSEIQQYKRVENGYEVPSRILDIHSLDELASRSISLQQISRKNDHSMISLLLSAFSEKKSNSTNPLQKKVSFSGNSLSMGK